MSLADNPFAGDAPPPQAPCAPGATPDLGDAWAQASEDERDVARARLAAVRHADDLAAAGMRRMAADAAAAGAAGVSASALGAWRRRARRAPEATCVAALLDARRTGRPHSIGSWPAAREALAALGLEFAGHLTAEQARDALLADSGWAPSVSTVARWLARWRAENKRAIGAVTNPDRHRSRGRPALGRADEAVTALNQLWEVDSTIADIRCADGKRYALIVVVDVYSRRAAVLVTPRSRAQAIAALIRRCLLEWGVPAVVKTDQGKDYVSRYLSGAFEDLDVTHATCLPYRPELKPFVERFIGTLSRALFPMLPGFTGHSVADAQALRERVSFAARRGEPPLQFGVALTPAALQHRVDTWCGAMYERRAHAGLDGETPFLRAASWPGAVRRIEDARALDALLAPAPRGGGRKIARGGISVGGREYIAAELGAHVGADVTVRLDPTNPGRIHVYRRTGVEGRRTEFLCIAEDPEVTGADRAEIAARARALADTADREARQWAADLKRRYEPEGAMDRMLARAAEEAENVVALPRRGEAHETPALAEAARAAGAAAAKGPREGTGDGPSARMKSARRRIAAANRHFMEDD